VTWTSLALRVVLGSTKTLSQLQHKSLLPYAALHRQKIDNLIFFTNRYMPIEVILMRWFIAGLITS
jgi:hypothetical protein